MDKTHDPSQLADDIAQMQDNWRQVRAILGGIKTMREAGTTYLPQFLEEDDEVYDQRLQATKMTNVFRDVIENLSQRPFSKQVDLSDETKGGGKEMQDFIWDVDGSGRSMHTFASEIFFDGVAYGIEWVLVDYPRGLRNATRAQEKEAGARVKWLRYDALSVLAADTAIIKGREEFVHVRLRESRRERKGFTVETIPQIRVLEREEISPGLWGPPEWSLWEEQQVEGKVGKEWVRVDEGALTIDTIPLVPFMTGRRDGNCWKLFTPMEDAADLQVDLYQQESAHKHVKNMSAFPMLVGEGVTPETGEGGKPKPMTFGPMTVLYAPATGEGGSPRWNFLEPDGQSLTQLSGDIKDTIKEIRELGRQPLTAQSGNLTVITTQVAAQKGNTAIQAWAMGLKLSLERMLELTAKWMGIKGFEPVVYVDTDFDLTWADNDTYAHVLKLRETGEISRTTALNEAKRRHILSDDYDPEGDLDALLEEIEDDEEDAPDPVDPPPPPEGEDEEEGDDETTETEEETTP
jgi:hypothetical protein